jgi:hypothetical protein
MYKLFKNPDNGNIAGVQKEENIWIPFSNDNTDYANFKKEILADEAQLQDADGNTMTPEQAKTYVATLP